MFRRLIAVALVAATPAFSESVTVEAPWARATPPGADTAAFYLTVKDKGAPDRLLSATSPIASKTELHMTMKQGEVMQMHALEHGIEVAPGRPVVFKPGGLHIMLMGLKRPLKQGESVPLTLVFEKAGQVETKVPVGPVGARGPDEHAGH